MPKGLRPGPRKSIIVPPGGFAGLGDNSNAAQALFSGFVGGKASPARRKKRKTTTKKKRSRATRKKASARRAPKGRLKKGSPEAKRRMAKLRKMRKK